MTAKTLRDLKPAAYNPRTITTKKREALLRSYVDFGDLSGIVVNETTGNMVGGHQRRDVFKNRESIIISQDHRDATGTVALGYVKVPLAEGGTMRIPYRRVRWDRKREMAANISANSGGGEFDEVKLGRILAELRDDKFPIESISMDSMDIKKAVRAFENENKRRVGIDGEGSEFGEIDVAALKDAAEHACPRCGHRWSGQTKPSFGELHRLTDDNPVKIEARRLQKKIERDRRAAAAEAPARGRRRAD